MKLMNTWILKSLLTGLLALSSHAAFAQSQTGGTFLGTGSTLHSDDQAKTQKKTENSQKKQKNKTGVYKDTRTTGSGTSLYPSENPSNKDNRSSD